MPHPPLSRPRCRLSTNTIKTPNYCTPDDFHPSPAGCSTKRRARSRASFNRDREWLPPKPKTLGISPARTLHARRDTLSSRFVYRHKGVNHHQAAIEGVVGLALVLEEKCKAPEEGVGVLPRAPPWIFVSLLAPDKKERPPVPPRLPHKRRLNGRFRVHETAKRTSLLFRSVLDYFTLLFFFPFSIRLFASLFSEESGEGLRGACRYCIDARRFVSDSTGSRPRDKSKPREQWSLVAYLRSYWLIFGDDVQLGSFCSAPPRRERAAVNGLASRD